MTQTSLNLFAKSILIIATSAAPVAVFAQAQLRPTPVAQSANFDAPVEAPAVPTFAQANAVIQKNCIGCHSNGIDKGGVNLETYENIVANKDMIVKTVSSGKMPKRAVMDEESKAILLNYIAAGAPAPQGAF